MEQSDWLENRYNSIGKSWEDTEDIKDNVIDEMANTIRKFNIIQGFCIGNNSIGDIKQYFYKKVRNNGIKRK